MYTFWLNKSINIFIMHVEIKGKCVLGTDQQVADLHN